MGVEMPLRLGDVGNDIGGIRDRSRLVSKEFLDIESLGRVVVASPSAGVVRAFLRVVILFSPFCFEPGFLVQFLWGLQGKPLFSS